MYSAIDFFLSSLAIYTNLKTINLKLKNLKLKTNNALYISPFRQLI